MNRRMKRRMNRRILIFTIICITIINSPLFSQNFGMGLLIDEASLENNAAAVQLMRGDYSDLPPAVSLKEFSPEPGQQGSYGTCAAWSTAYAARTMLEAILHGWNKSEISKNAFSPSFIYNQIRMQDNCYGGTSIIHALDILKDQGGVKLEYFEYNCDREVTNTDKEKAEDFKILEYREIAHRNTKDKVTKIKKSISEMKPVVIGISCPKSFSTAKEVWKPSAEDYKKTISGHGLCVVGYDDDKYGGAFEILNSWGKNWGNKGYTWIKYSDFQHFCLLAFELIDKRITEPDTYDLSGSLSFIDSDGFPMRIKSVGNRFRMEKEYSTGVLFELFISNNEPAYVYSFSYDTTKSTYKIFPFHDKMTPYLAYKQNNIAIPDEGSFNMLDETSGISTYCFIYSNEAIDLDILLANIELSESSISEAFNHFMSKKIVANENLEFVDGDILSFKAKSNGKSLVPIFIDIVHKQF